MNIKQIKFEKKTFINKKTKVLGVISVIILLLTLCIALGKAINVWYDTHYLQFNQVVKVELDTPVEIRTREVKTQEIVQVINQIPEYKEMTPIEQYICDKFGPGDCKIAIAVAKSESGLRESAFNTYNKNGTLDVGIFQVNSVHFNQPGCSLKELVDQYKNVDCAYSIFKASGWNAWSAFNSGNFKEKL